MRAIYLHLNKAGLHYTAIAVFSGHPPDVRLYLYFHLQQQNGNVMRRKTVRIFIYGGACECRNKDRASNCLVG